MLGLIALQIGSGLFADDDIAFRGPLADLAGDAWSSRLTALHAWTQYGLIAVVLLHAAAIIYYVRVRRETLVRPMLSGRKELEPALAHDLQRQRSGRTVLAFVLASAVALATVYAAAGGLAPSPPVVTAPAPAW